MSMKTPLPSDPVPMFPLPGVFLFPAQILPLHVFEERYRQLVNDCLDGPGRIVVPTIVGEGSPPPLLPVAGLGEIVRHEKLEDGRFHIWLLGLQRVCIQETPSDRLYRKTMCMPFDEVEADAEESEELQALLRQATASRLPTEMALPPKTPTNILTDLLVQTLQAPQEILEELFSEQSIAARARKALAAHEKFPQQGEG